MTLTLIAAVARNGVIGAGGSIPWHLPEDFAHFRETTMGKTLVMGRATYESIGRPLPGRLTVVLTRDPTWAAEGVVSAGSLSDALAVAVGDVFVAGGAQVYAAAMPYADAQILSAVELEPDGDTFYPSIDPEVWEVVEREPRGEFTVIRWSRRRPDARLTRR